MKNIIDIRNIKGWNSYIRKIHPVVAVTFKETSCIETLDSHIMCYPGDVLVRDESGNLSIWKKDIFDSTFMENNDV
jgi:hypothetical protein